MASWTIPTVVAIDCLSMYHREEGVIDALLGEPYVAIIKLPDGSF